VSAPHDLGTRRHIGMEPVRKLYIGLRINGIKNKNKNKKKGVSGLQCRRLGRQSCHQTGGRGSYGLGPTRENETEFQESDRSL